MYTFSTYVLSKALHLVKKIYSIALAQHSIFAVKCALQKIIKESLGRIQFLHLKTKVHLVWRGKA